MGRPSGFTQELGDIICDRIIAGESVRAITQDEEMPASSMIFRWLAANKEFREQYARAKEAQAEVFAEDLLEIADDGTNDWMEQKDRDEKVIGWRENGEALRRSVLRVDTRKWLLSKLLAKKYGDKVQNEHSGPDGGPIQAAIQVTFVRTNSEIKDL